MSNAAAPKTISYPRLITSHSRVTQTVLEYQYRGKGTKDEPYIVTWVPSDPGNPMEFSTLKKWSFSGIAAVAMLSTVFDSSAFTGESQHTCW
jgi:hypothetical protein